MALKRHWRALLGSDERVPTHSKMSNALKYLSGCEKRLHPSFRDGRVRIYPVSEALFEADLAD